MFPAVYRFPAQYCRSDIPGETLGNKSTYRSVVFNSIASRAPASELQALIARRSGRSLQDEALRLVTEDITTISEVIRSLSALEVQR